MFQTSLVSLLLLVLVLLTHKVSRVALNHTRDEGQKIKKKTCLIYLFLM